MATGRRRDEWERVCVIVSLLRAIHYSEKVDPSSLNPYRRQPKRTAEMRERDNKYAWQLLAAGFREMNMGRRKS
jgi:hypothetical protein